MFNLQKHSSKTLNGLLTLLTLVLLLIFSVVSFENHLLFSLCFILLMTVLCVAHSNRSNLFTLFIILALNRLTDEGIDSIILYSIAGTLLYVKAVFYFVSITVLVVLRYQMLSKISLLSLLVVLPVEYYWYQTNYSAPMIYFFYVGLAQTVFMRYTLLVKGRIFSFIKGVGSQNMDFNVSEVCALSGFVMLAMIAEYLIRHLSGLDIDIVYDSYEFLQHGISVMWIFIILYYSVFRSFLLKQSKA